MERLSLVGGRLKRRGCGLSEDSTAELDSPRRSRCPYCRLRLEDPSGLPIGNLKTYFRDVKAIVFYFGSVFGEQALREFHRVSSDVVFAHVGRQGTGRQER